MDFANVITKVDSDLFITIVESCIDSLCGRAENFTECSLTADETLIVSKAIKSAIETILKLNLGPQQVPTSEWNKADLKYVELLHNCLEKRPGEVKAIRVKLILNKGSPNLQDYNWDVKWVLGSSSLSSKEEPLANFSFYLPGGVSHLVEMNKKEIDIFIQSLENK
ncbi:uncharacterized protein LOC132196636 [Neocloeon triangulifer]|uniref:uncharacterized protein LOC132196636 n=1 Tax=Neocloeon triangulifer TaxID=2078957 RepID=UPI00286F12B3|nr:uncharacterized protein LOC132196636 [Neocloeon triangulifer]